jgi:hypothetical protein
MNKGIIIGIAVGVFFVGLGVGYAIFNTTMQQQSLETESLLRFNNAQNMLLQGSNMMEQGSNIMMEGIVIMEQDRERGEEMVRRGSSMMEQGYSMMMQGSNMMDETMMNMQGMSIQNFNDMMNIRDNMMGIANMMMQDRESIMNQGMDMNQNMMNMGQYTSMMGSMNINMQQQMQGMMGMNQMMGRGMMQGMMGMDMNQNMMGMMSSNMIDPLTIENVEKEMEEFVKVLDPNFAIKDIMEFDNNFYLIVYEKDTGIGAFEMLVWKTGTMEGMIHPEPGPNMMWNTKYGMFPSDVEMKIDAEEAKEIAQRYLNENMQGTEAREIEEFYGYYTLHVEKDGKTIGMLSVNGITGDVWYHHWHGTFIKTL